LAVGFCAKSNLNGQGSFRTLPFLFPIFGIDPWPLVRGGCLVVTGGWKRKILDTGWSMPDDHLIVL
jgi:hypothetical protein